jgi:hypothetical protein
MASDTKNVKLGVCKITYGGVDLGYTMGGVEVTVKTDTHKVMVDQFGKTPINEYIMGRELTVKVPLAETTLENLVATMPGATLTVAAGEVPAYVTVGTGIGTNLLDLADVLVLHPKGLDDADVSEDFVVPLAATAGALKFSYKLDQERVYDVEFTGYPDPATGKMFTVGKASA